MASSNLNRDISGTDFFKRGAQTPFRRNFNLCGASCEIRTNSESILAAAHESFPLMLDGESSPDLHMRVWVDAADKGEPPWPKPYVRGLGQLVYAGFDSGSSLLIDLRTRRCIGRFSQRMSTDGYQWREVILPMMLSILSGSLGMAEIHCACVARNGRGLLLAGPSGSGKSSLSVALGRAGFGFLSDDRTFCKLQRGKLIAWGLPILTKMRADASAWFHELQDDSPTDRWKGEPVFRLDVGRQFGIQRIRECEPHSVLFLDRRDVQGFHLHIVPPNQAARRLEDDMMAELPEVAAEQATTIARLAALSCCRLEYGGPPHLIAAEISRHFGELERIS